jgi:hypothetical protein
MWLAVLERAAHGSLRSRREAGSPRSVSRFIKRALFGWGGWRSLETDRDPFERLAAHTARTDARWASVPGARRPRLPPLTLGAEMKGIRKEAAPLHRRARGYNRGGSALLPPAWAPAGVACDVVLGERCMGLAQRTRGAARPRAGGVEHWGSHIAAIRKSASRAGVEVRGARRSTAAGARTTH